jgi:hypothetical protein
MLFDTTDDVKLTVDPAQISVGPEAEIVGAADVENTLVEVEDEVELQPPPSVYVTENDPVEETIIDWVVAPVDQVFPDAYDDVKVTLPPWQKVNAPLAVIVGVEGADGSFKTGLNVLELQPVVLTNVIE